MKLASKFKTATVLGAVCAAFAVPAHAEFTASANNRCGRRLPRKSVAFAPIFAPICSRKSPEGGPSGLFLRFQSSARTT